MKQYLLILIWGVLLTHAAFAQKTMDTFRIYFDLNVDALNERSRSFLDSLNYANILVPGIPISIIGHADYLASDAYNQDLSERRAGHVKAYLNSFGIRDADLKLVFGNGERNSRQLDSDAAKKNNRLAGRGVATDRRVEIVMERQRAGTTKRLRTRYVGADTTIKMQPWRNQRVPPSTSDPGFDINKIPIGGTFILKNIRFPMGRHVPRQESYKELDRLLNMMTQNPKVRIQIEGHICCVDNMPDAMDLDTRKLDLSVNRAKFVCEYLEQRGVNKNRLTYIGFGKSRPIIANEQNEQEASTNRRVEIRVLDR